LYAENKSFTPGPGNYRKPSDFGNYDHLNEINIQRVKRNNSGKENNKT